MERFLCPMELCHDFTRVPILFAAFCVLGIPLGSVCTVCAAQTTIAAPEEASDAPALESAIDAFLTARRWLDAPNLPQLDDSAAAIPLNGTSMVVVLLRTAQGRLVGIGEDAGGDGLMLRRALGRAFAKALGHESIVRVRESFGDEIGKALSIEIELCGTATPILGRTIKDAATRVAPGIDGIALRRGEEYFRLSPARLLSIDSAERPEGAIRMLISDAGLPSEDLPQLGVRDSVALLSFRSMRVGQSTPSAQPISLSRAGRVIDALDCTRSAQGAFLEALITRLARDVVQLAPNQSPIITGDYDGIAATHEPALARLREQALVAFTLATASQWTHLSDAVRARATESAERAMESVRRAPEPPTPAVDAYVLLALNALEPLANPEHATARAALVKRLSETSAKERDADSIALIACALLQAKCALGDELLTQAWTQDENVRVRNLAWLALGESLQAESTHAKDLRNLAALVTARQLIDAPVGTPADQLGGFDLGARTGAQAGGRLSSVDSQSSRPTYALALLLANEDVTTSDNLNNAVRTQALALRFLRQLMLDAPLTGLMRDGDDAQDRIRASLGTYRCPLAAQAMTILAVGESLRAIDARSAAQRQ